MQHLEYNSDIETPFVEVRCGSYDEYEYRDGDVVYCDIPYIGTNARYVKDFDHDKFFKWAKSREYPVYISHEELPKQYADGLEIVWSKTVNRTCSKDTNSVRKTEYLYKNKIYLKDIQYYDRFF